MNPPAAAGARAGTFRVGLGEAAGAVADLGVLVPLAAALILVNGLAAGPVLLCAGLLVVASGLVFRIPFPVQPLKALTAVAVAERLSPEVIHAAGLEIAAFLLLLSFHGIADLLARLFTKPVVRALQLGVGVLLALAAVDLVTDPPAVFLGTPPSPWPVVLAGAAFAGVAWAAARGRYWWALTALAAGVAAAVLVGRPELGGPSFALPSISIPAPADFATAFFLLVVPQLPLTFGNAVVAVSDLAGEYFGPVAARVRPSPVCLSCAGGNLVSGVLGGMPMCHGAGGLTAHVRLGARRAGMNLLLGGALVGLGLFFGPQAPVILGLLPVWALAAFLAYAGIRHALLVADLRGWPLGLAVAAGLAGALLGNLAVTAGAALIAVHATGLVRRRRVAVEST
ncbi:MAG TPA: putative sulfate/molybdate transporter [Actinomycetota bacterium]|nr:putative sulfate/molybdate transporter [Actinomycetota bacterium]